MHPQRFLAASAALVSVLSLAVLAACGGGGSSNTGSVASTSSSSSKTTATSVKLSTYITDNLTTDYSQVWVGIRSIVAVDSSGNSVTLFASDDSSGYTTFDLRSLASVGELMSAVSVNAGDYRSIEVTLDSDVSLVLASDNSTIAAQFTSDGSDKVLKVGVSLDTTASTTLVLDFNLENFSYDATTGLVTADVSRKGDGALKEFKVHQGEVRGTLVSVDPSANSITVNDARLGSTTVLALTSDAVITRTSDGSTLALSDLSAGMNVRARGVVTSSSTDSTVTVQVSTVQVSSTSTSSSSMAALTYRGQGTVQSVDGTMITLLLTQASFLPTSAIVTIDASQAAYAHGQSSDLVAGATLSFRATYDSASDTYTATSLDIDGTASASERKKRGNQSVAVRSSEVKGLVTAITDGVWTVQATQTHGSVTAGSSYAVDVSGALVKATTGCVVVGSRIEARGALSGTDLTARVVRLLSECGSTDDSSTASTST